MKRRKQYQHRTAGSRLPCTRANTPAPSSPRAQQRMEIHEKPGSDTVRTGSFFEYLINDAGRLREHKRGAGGPRRFPGLPISVRGSTIRSQRKMARMPITPSCGL
jgi:hypothetical protein